MVTLPRNILSAPLWKKIYLHARGAISQRYAQEQSTNWVKVPFKLVEHYRAMAYAILQTKDIDPAIRAFVYNYTQGIESATQAYLTDHYGPGIFQVNKGLSEAAFTHLYQALANHQQLVLKGHFDTWENDQPNQEGPPDGA